MAAAADAAVAAGKRLIRAKARFQLHRAASFSAAALLSSQCALFNLSRPRRLARPAHPTPLLPQGNAGTTNPDMQATFASAPVGGGGGVGGGGSGGKAAPKKGKAAAPKKRSAAPAQVVGRRQASCSCSCGTAHCAVRP